MGKILTYNEMIQLFKDAICDKRYIFVNITGIQWSCALNVENLEVRDTGDSIHIKDKNDFKSFIDKDCIDVMFLEKFDYSDKITINTITNNFIFYIN
ncbi:hypothetical protein Ana3638_13155 [Anaerocolumna sedimenticola]|uniref:Uncharacterized protein n=1 Tax=Anaerocolumna sedimenticola TaxID=2696063 RepID=A0A6P1TPQ6_9FIRM|nr:hypothetical protein [Anaerocolumna sedimenticola]QHQ61605.1 hypothetical protein Ana3638_13155 [Anaerocolumna sedimenticola]